MALDAVGRGHVTPFPTDRFDDMVAKSLRLLMEVPEADRRAFMDRTEQELGELHHGLGTAIRNRFKLWAHKWEPEVREGVDYSAEHPDAVSFRVIKEVWRQANRRRET